MLITKDVSWPKRPNSYQVWINGITAEVIRGSGLSRLRIGLGADLVTHLVTAARVGSLLLPVCPWVVGGTRILRIAFKPDRPFAARRDEKNHEQSG